MRIKANMLYNNRYIVEEDCIIEKYITVPNDKFNNLCQNLLEDNPLVSDNKDFMFRDDEYIRHCVMFIDTENGNGLLVYNEGHDYARETAFIPNAKLLIDMDRYSVLKEFNNRMIKVADEIIAKAVDCNENGMFIANMCKYDEVGKIPVDRCLIDEMLSESDLITETELFDDEIIIQLNSEIHHEEDEAIEMRAKSEADYDARFEQNM